MDEPGSREDAVIATPEGNRVMGSMLSNIPVPVSYGIGSLRSRGEAIILWLRFSCRCTERRLRVPPRWARPNLFKGCFSCDSDTFAPRAAREVSSWPSWVGPRCCRGFGGALAGVQPRAAKP